MLSYDSLPELISCTLPITVDVWKHLVDYRSSSSGHLLPGRTGPNVVWWLSDGFLLSHVLHGCLKCAWWLSVGYPNLVSDGCLIIAWWLLDGCLMVVHWMPTSCLMFALSAGAGEPSSRPVRDANLVSRWLVLYSLGGSVCKIKYITWCGALPGCLAAWLINSTSVIACYHAFILCM